MSLAGKAQAHYDSFNGLLKYAELIEAELKGLRSREVELTDRNLELEAQVARLQSAAQSRAVDPEELESLREENKRLTDALVGLQEMNGRQHRDLKDAREAKYAGCYYLGDKKGRLGTAQEVLLVLGGEDYLAESLCIAGTTVRHWRRTGFITPRYRNDIEELLSARGYVADKNIFKSIVSQPKE